MYYLRTKSAVDAIKFTVTKEKKAEPKPEEKKPVINMAPETPVTEPAEPTKVEETDDNYSFSQSQSAPVVEPLVSPMHSASETIPQVQSAPSNNEPMFVDVNDAAYQAAKLQCSIDNPDDCEMCGS